MGTHSTHGESSGQGCTVPGRKLQVTAYLPPIGPFLDPPQPHPSTFLIAHSSLLPALFWHPKNLGLTKNPTTLHPIDLSFFGD